MGLPAYPPQATPQMPEKPGTAGAARQATATCVTASVGAQGLTASACSIACHAGLSGSSALLGLLGQRAQQHPLQPQPHGSGPRLGGRYARSASNAPAGPALGLEDEAGGGAQGEEYQPPVLPPAQAGPLAHYPDYSTVDAAKKWQRIQEWVARDSSGEGRGGGGGGGMPPPPPSVGTAADDTRSVDSTLLELELERTRASMQVRAGMWAGGLTVLECSKAGSRGGAYA